MPITGLKKLQLCIVTLEDKPENVDKNRIAFKHLYLIICFHSLPKLKTMSRSNIAASLESNTSEARFLSDTSRASDLSRRLFTRAARVVILVISQLIPKTYTFSAQSETDM